MSLAAYTQLAALQTLAAGTCPNCGDRTRRLVCVNGSRTCGRDFSRFASEIKELKRPNETPITTEGA
jgi:hypothetical protein